MLDHELAAYVMSLPAHFKVPRGQTKWILRRAMRGLVPDAILDAPKQGFGVPYAEWLRGPLGPYLESVLLDESVTRAGFFAPTALARTVSEHIRGVRDHGFLLWKALHLQLWARRFEVDLLAI